jgi:hypothetical protein
MSTTDTPRLRLVTSDPDERTPEAPPRTGEIEDLRAWGLVWDAINDALTLTLSAPVHKRLLRCRALIGVWTGRQAVRTAGGDA